MNGKPGLTATLENKEHRPAEMESYRIPQAGLEETASASQAAGVQVHTTTCSSAATWSPEPGQPGSVTHISVPRVWVGIFFTLLLPQVQPFFNSCLNDCLRHAVTVFCPDIPKTSGRRETVVAGIHGS